MPSALNKVFLAVFVAFPWAGLAAGQTLEERAAVQAQEEELALVYGDRATVSIATGRKQPIRRAPAVATVITAEDIVAMGAVDLDEVLETVPGLHVTRHAGLYKSLYIIRGIHGGPVNPQVLVLQNGAPLTKMYTGDRGVFGSEYPVENIARIEVIRGPGSALYGADAYAGVINIITKSAAEIDGTQAGARAGSFGTWDTWTLHGGKLGSADVAGYLRVGSTEGFKGTVSADAATRLDQIFGTSASLAPGPVNTGHDSFDADLDVGDDRWRWRSSYKLRDNVETAAGVSSALDPRTKARGERFTTDLSWIDQQFARDWGLGLIAHYLYYSEETPNGVMLFPPGTTFPTGTFPDGVIGGPNRWEKQLRLSAFTTYSGFAGHAVRVGVGHDDLDLYRATTYKNFLLSPAGVPIPTGPVIDYSDIQPHILPQRRKVDYVYVQDEWQFAKDWALTAGVRHDDYSDFGGTTNPRAALVWEAAYNLTAKLLYGRAFRAPSFNDQYGINPVANGNPNLRPETIETVEAAFSWQARKDVEVNLSLFRYEMEDIIRAVPNPTPPGATFNNTGNQNGRGMELEVAWDVDRRLRLSGHYAYQRSIDELTNQDAGNAPRDHVYVRADWRYGRGWLLSSQINHVADRRRVAGDTRPAVPDYTTVDVAAHHQLKNDQWHFTLSVRNLFDEDAREPSLFAPPVAPIPNDLPLPGRSLYAQVSYKFGMDRPAPRPSDPKSPDGKLLSLR